MPRFIAQKPLTINATVVPAGTVVTSGQLHDRNVEAMLKRGEITYTTDVTDSTPAQTPQDSEPAAQESDDVTEMTAAEIVEGLGSGRLNADDVRAAEMQRTSPRKTVLRALGDE